MDKKQWNIMLSALAMILHILCWIFLWTAFWKALFLAIAICCFWEVVDICMGVNGTNDSNSSADNAYDNQGIMRRMKSRFNYYPELRNYIEHYEHQVMLLERKRESLLEILSVNGDNQAEKSSLYQAIDVGEQMVNVTLKSAYNRMNAIYSRETFLMDDQESLDAYKNKIAYVEKQLDELLNCVAGLSSGVKLDVNVISDITESLKELTGECY